MALLSSVVATMRVIEKSTAERAEERKARAGLLFLVRGGGAGEEAAVSVRSTGAS